MQVWKSQSELKNINICKINDGDLTSQTLGLSESYFVVTGRMDRWETAGVLLLSNQVTHLKTIALIKAPLT